MRLKAIATIAAVIVLAAAGSVSATHFGAFTGGADCSGFWGYGDIVFFYLTPTVYLNYEVTLSQSAVPVTTITGIVEVQDESPTFNVSVPWGMELCGDYSVSGHFWFTDIGGNDSRDINATFTCECGGGACHFTPGYWKNHPEAWPVLTLTVGGISYNQTQLIEILSLPVRQDPTVILAHHLIAAKLNVANGADDSINGAIADADAILVTYPISSMPPKDVKNMIIDAKNALATYNQMILPGCEGYIEPCFDRAMLTTPAPGESSSWGNIKNLYR